MRVSIHDRPENHYDFLDKHFDTVLTRMGREDLVDRRGNFSSSGDKYQQYKGFWEKAQIPFNHGAIMYHLMELIFYNEVRQTKNGWVHPYQWVIDNYNAGHLLRNHMHDLI